MKRMIKMMMFFLSACSMLMIQCVYANEVSDEVFTVTIHKRLFDQPIRFLIQNTGQEVDIGGTPLAGAEFQVYDVTERYHNLLKKNSSLKAMQEIQEEYTQSVPTQSLEKKTTDTDGIAVFHNLVEKQTNQQAAYVFVETATPANITMTQKAAPIVLVTPIFLLDANGEQTNTKLSNVHIYPKNIGYVPNKPDKPILPDNPKKPSKPVLPMTGQAKSFLSLLGIAIILAVVWIWRKKTKK